jgi:hypothetical protein
LERASAYHLAPNAARVRATVDLISVAFFFLSQASKYTMPTKKVRTRTIQFWAQDVKFQTATGFVIPNMAPNAHLLQADSLTLWLDNQNNGQGGATIHHTACTSWFCPVQALARRVSHILLQGCPASTRLSFVSLGVHVVASNVTNLVQHVAIETNLVPQGYDLRRVSTHSLKASGAMALKLQGINNSLIMKIGRWTGLTFLTYIHSQIGALNAGLA